MLSRCLPKFCCSFEASTLGSILGSLSFYSYTTGSVSGGLSPWEFPGCFRARLSTTVPSFSVISQADVFFVRREKCVPDGTEKVELPWGVEGRDHVCDLPGCWQKAPFADFLDSNLLQPVIPNIFTVALIIDGCAVSLILYLIAVLKPQRFLWQSTSDSRCRG